MGQTCWHVWKTGREHGGFWWGDPKDIGRLSRRLEDNIKRIFKKCNGEAGLD